MGRTLILGIILSLISNIAFSQIAINADGNPAHHSAGLDVSFSDKGVLLPRLTAQQRDSIFEPAEGLLIYCVDCGFNATGTLCIFQNGGWRSFNLDCIVPMTPPPLSHTAGMNQIVWKWGSNPITAGYKWNTVNDYSTATDLFSATTYTETDLDCWTEYTRYVWGYNECGPSIPLVMTQWTEMIPFPTSVAFGGGSNATDTSIVWFWGQVSGALGYRINDVDDFYTGEDAPTFLFYESGLTCLTTYDRYVWAYDECGYSTPTIITGSTIDNPPDPPLAATHVPAITQIEWNWQQVPDATGYKWSATNNIGASIDLGNLTTYPQTGLDCNTLYSSYVWAYGPCGTSVSAELTQRTDTDPPDAPLAGTHVPSAYQIVWNWNVVAGADGYLWNDIDDVESANDLETQTTFTEIDLDCDSFHTRYIWAYDECGVSVATLISATTLIDVPPAPTAGVHDPSIDQVVWNWNTVTGAIGYMWNDTEDFETAEELGLETSYTETGLDCNTPYTRYVWVVNNCTTSIAAILTESTIYEVTEPPVAGIHDTLVTRITWNWEPVADAIGYSWGLTDNYANSIDMFANTSHMESGLVCDMQYTRYVWAYNICGPSVYTVLTANTLTDPPPAPISGVHAATSSSIVWNWWSLDEAEGYKFGSTLEYDDATDLGNVTSFLEPGLTCGVLYTRYLWAYNDCGVSEPTTLTMSTTDAPPASPVAGVIVPSEYQIVWDWEAVGDATGYKWNTIDDLPSAKDMGNKTDTTETNLDCNTPYTRYIWAYNDCAHSAPTTLISSTLLDPPAAPDEGSHTATLTDITWRWQSVIDATGYKWNTTNDIHSAQDVGNKTDTTESNLPCNEDFTRYVWAYSNCGESVTTVLSYSTLEDPPAAPAAGTHVPSAFQIIWNWNSVEGADGYKWSTVNDYSNAQDMGTNLSKTQNSMNCNEEHTSYVWAYGPCGVSAATEMTESTLDESPNPPAEGTHSASSSSITWNWNTVSGASGYKFGETDNYAAADDLSTATSIIEDNLECDLLYTRYIWAYNDCGPSAYTIITQSTTNDPPAVPTAGTHSVTRESIEWNWNSSPGTVGYLWSATNDASTAIEKGTSTSHFEDGLTCGESYTRYVWAYNDCDTSAAAVMSQSTMICWQCGEPLYIDHVAGTVAPVTKSTTYGTVTNIPGEPTKCWTTNNLGSDRQATSVNDNTEASAGWYWQFNRKQGYKHDGANRTPNTTWITSISEDMTWGIDEDPCRLLLGGEWRIPTYIEWYMIDVTGGWVNPTDAYNSELKLHLAGRLSNTAGTLSMRGSRGYYWSSAQSFYDRGWLLYLLSGGSEMANYEKAYGFSIRCIRE